MSLSAEIVQRNGARVNGKIHIDNLSELKMKVNVSCL